MKRTRRSCSNCATTRCRARCRMRTLLPSRHLHRLLAHRSFPALGADMYILPVPSSGRHRQHRAKSRFERKASVAVALLRAVHCIYTCAAKLSQVAAHPRNFTSPRALVEGLALTLRILSHLDASRRRRLHSTKDIRIILQLALDPLTGRLCRFLAFLS